MEESSQCLRWKHNLACTWQIATIKGLVFIQSIRSDGDAMDATSCHQSDGAPLSIELVIRARLCLYHANSKRLCSLFRTVFVRGTGHQLRPPS
eukprot:scaffold319_cov362-Pavlova_lutheri.AAC.20